MEVNQPTANYDGVSALNYCKWLRSKYCITRVVAFKENQFSFSVGWKSVWRSLVSGGKSPSCTTTAGQARVSWWQLFPANSEASSCVYLFAYTVQSERPVQLRPPQPDICLCVQTPEYLIARSRLPIDARWQCFQVVCILVGSRHHKTNGQGKIGCKLKKCPVYLVCVLDLWQIPMCGYCFSCGRVEEQEPLKI